MIHDLKRREWFLTVPVQRCRWNKRSAVTISDHFYINVVDLSAKAPLFGKEGLGEILFGIALLKIPLNPPLEKGEEETVVIWLNFFH